MDSIESLKPEQYRLTGISYKLAKKYIAIYEHNTPEEVGNKFASSFGHNFPKVLFIYLPIFAFWLWLLHGKKRWYYFDHGIFALHYFSFLLITVLLLVLNEYFLQIINHIVYAIFFVISSIAIILWQVYYFYRAHRKMYHESFLVNIVKASILLMINLITITGLLIAFAFLTIYNLH